MTTPYLFATNHTVSKEYSIEKFALDEVLSELSYDGLTLKQVCTRLHVGRHVALNILTKQLGAFADGLAIKTGRGRKSNLWRV